MTYLNINDLSKSFGKKRILNRIRLSLKEGEMLCILGPSGCGKTTLLRSIAGLETINKGAILLKGEDITQTPTHLRKFGFMFQDYALFPHMNVFENIAFGLKMERQSHNKIKAKTAEMIDLVGLTGFEHRNVDELSGGERQRVALARSLATNPRLLLLDEPFASLDRMLRKKLAGEIAGIIRKTGITTLFVTHDHLEAFTIGDTIAVMEKGNIEQIASPETLYRHPENSQIAQFLGFKNLLPTKVIEKNRLLCAMGPITLSMPSGIKAKEIMILFRPECATLLDSVKPSDKNEITIYGRVIHRIFQGHYYSVVMHTNNNTELTWHLSSQPVPPDVGEMIGVSYAHRDIIFLHS